MATKENKGAFEIILHPARVIVPTPPPQNDSTRPFKSTAYEHFPILHESLMCGMVMEITDFLPCGTCRHRKKRCYHLGSTDGVKEHNSRAKIPESEKQTPRQREKTALPSENQYFISNSYNPESVLEQISNLPDSAPRAEPVQSESCTEYSLSERPAGENEKLPSDTPKAGRRVREKEVKASLSASHRSYLEDVGAFLELPKQTTDALLPIYNSVFDDLIPIVDGTAVFRDYSNGESSTYLANALCLVTSKATQAAPFLRFKVDGPVLKPQEFASKLLTTLDAAMKADLEPDKITRVQILALMQFNNDGPGGMRRASGYLSQAISEAWALSLHLEKSTHRDPARKKFLWWSLRNCDRLNKPIMGAGPFMIDDTDIGIQRISADPDSYRSQVMAVSLRLGDLVATATKAYKASCKNTVDFCNEFPTLEELTSDVESQRFHKAHRAYLAIWYHVCAILSCRYNGPGSVQYSRRLKSANCVIELICREGHENLPALPLVPYVLSMSTVVIYRALRDKQRDNDSAYKDISICCDALDSLAQLWTNTQGIAKLARRLWRILGASRSSSERRTEERSQQTPTEEATFREAPTASLAINDRCISSGVDETLSKTIPSNPNATPSQASFSEQQPSRAWSESNEYYLHLDRAFDHLFDCGIPNIFPDASLLDFPSLPDDNFDDTFLLSSDWTFSGLDQGNPDPNAEPQSSLDTL